MKSLWAPWRMKFILNARHGMQGCFLCELPKKKQSVKSLVLYKGKKAFVILNRYPYSNGHLMVVPHRHLAQFEELNQEEHKELGLLIGRSITALKKGLRAEGINVGLNLGKVAGAGVEDHVHYHVVPRWLGDSNFMPVVGKARVIPEFLEDTYKRLVKYF